MANFGFFRVSHPRDRIDIYLIASTLELIIENFLRRYK